MDFYDFTLICEAIYKGAYKNPDILYLIFKILNTINDYRLSTFTGDSPKPSCEELLTLQNAKPLLKYFPNGRVLDLSTDKIDSNKESCVYLITKPNKEELIVKSLKEAGVIVGSHYSTLSRLLDNNNVDFEISIKDYKIRRYGIFI